jgi:SPP1 family predicted phage head-tail adaptor
MQAGRLNKRITIQRQQKIQKPSGQLIGEWVDVCTIWAEVNCTDSKAVDSNGVIQHEGLYRFFIRWRTGITADMRVQWDGRIFELTGPPADWKGERIGLTLITKELV